MKTIYINGEKLEHPENLLATLDHALTLFAQGKTLSTFALALNGDFVGKDDYPTTKINDGDSIDLLFPIQGG